MPRGTASSGSAGCEAPANPVVAAGGAGSGISDRPALPVMDLPSPNQDERGEKVDMLILHYTGMETARDAH